MPSRGTGSGTWRLSMYTSPSIQSDNTTRSNGTSLTTPAKCPAPDSPKFVLAPTSVLPLNRSICSAPGKSTPQTMHGIVEHEADESQVALTPAGQPYAVG